MIVYLHIPNADTLGFDEMKKLEREIETLARGAADRRGVGDRFLGSWEMERLSDSWSVKATDDGDLELVGESLFQAPVLRLVEAE